MRLIQVSQSSTFVLCLLMGAAFISVDVCASDPCDGLRVHLVRKERNDPDGQLIRGYVCEVIRDSYPELSRVSVRVHRHTFPSALTNFDCAPNPARIFGKNHGYTIRFDPRRILHSANPVDADTIRAILAHELGHLTDYRRRNIFGLTGSLGNLFIPKVRAKSEHWADFLSFYAGYKSGKRYIDGAIRYEYWIRAANGGGGRDHVGGGTKYVTYMEPATLEKIRDFVDQKILPIEGEVDRFFPALLKRNPIFTQSIEAFLDEYRIAPHSG